MAISPPLLALLKPAATARIGCGKSAFWGRCARGLLSLCDYDKKLNIITSNKFGFCCLISSLKPMVLMAISLPLCLLCSNLQRPLESFVGKIILHSSFFILHFAFPDCLYKNYSLLVVHCSL